MLQSSRGLSQQYFRCEFFNLGQCSLSCQVVLETVRAKCPTGNIGSHGVLFAHFQLSVLSRSGAAQCQRTRLVVEFSLCHENHYEQFGIHVF